MGYRHAGRGLGEFGEGPIPELDALDADDVRLEVNVVPEQPELLGRPRPGEERERDVDAVDDIIARGGQELCDLVRRQNKLARLVPLTLESGRHRRRTELVVLSCERQRSLEDLHRLVGAIVRNLVADQFVPRADASRGQLLHLFSAKKLDRPVLRLNAFARADDGATRLARWEGSHDVAGLERVGCEGDRPDRAALRLEPRGDGVGDSYGLARRVIGATVVSSQKPRAPLLSVALAFEKSLLPLACTRIAPIQDVARLLDDRAIL